MPVSIRKKNNKFIVKTPGGVKSKGSTKENAIKQERLLNAIEHGWKPKGTKQSKKNAVMKMRAK